MPRVVLDHRGRLLIPREMRALLGVRPGEAVQVELINNELRVRRPADPYAHLSPQQLMAEHVRMVQAHPQDAAAFTADLADWEAIPSDLPAEEWSDADFVPEPEPETEAG